MGPRHASLVNLESQCSLRGRVLDDMFKIKRQRFLRGRGQRRRKRIMLACCA